MKRSQTLEHRQDAMRRAIATELVSPTIIEKPILDLSEIIQILKDEIKPRKVSRFLSVKEKQIYRWGWRAGYQAGVRKGKQYEKK